MGSSDFDKVFDSSEELQITVKGPKTGREYSTPVWFVREGKTIFLLPVKGSKSQWYKNVHSSKKIKISSGKLSYDLTPLILTNSHRVGSVIDKFRKKHGATDVKKYYTVHDVALELTVP
jgi:hypothetical protein